MSHADKINKEGQGKTPANEAVADYDMLHKAGMSARSEQGRILQDYKLGTEQEKIGNEKDRLLFDKIEFLARVLGNFKEVPSIMARDHESLVRLVTQDFFELLREGKERKKLHLSAYEAYTLFAGNIDDIPIRQLTVKDYFDAAARVSAEMTIASELGNRGFPDQKFGLAVKRMVSAFMERLSLEAGSVNPMNYGRSGAGE